MITLIKTTEVVDDYGQMKTANTDTLNLLGKFYFTNYTNTVNPEFLDIDAVAVLLDYSAVSLGDKINGLSVIKVIPTKRKTICYLKDYADYC